MSRSRLVEVARVGRPHGVRGEVRVIPYQGDGAVLLQTKTVHLARDGQLAEHAVESARRAGRAVLLKVAGFRDRDAVGALTGCTVWVPREALPPLEPGEVYLVDLIGAAVVGPEGPVGTVTAVQCHPTVDSLVIQRPDGTTVEQPCSEPWVARLDAEAGQVELRSLEGLIS